jgi:hypothetical protein
MTMKKKQLIALGVTLFVLAACNNPFFPEKRDIGGRIAQTPVVTIDVTPENPYVLGDEVTITASAAVSDGGTLSYQWYSNDEESNEGGKLIPDETETSYAPSTSGAGTAYYYVEVTNTLGEETASAVSDTVEVTVYDVGTAAAIRSVGVDVIAPVKNGAPATTAVTDDSGYACTAVSWNPAHNPFEGGVAYTVTITLTAESSHTLIALRTAEINGQAATVTGNNGNTLTMSYTFAVTDTRAVSGIAVISQPSKLTYTHGDTLDLAGLAVRLTFDTAETEDVALAGFTLRNISTHPANGAVLHLTTNNNQPVVVHYGDKTANTDNLIVAKANPVVTLWPTAATITYGATLSTSALTGGTASVPGTFAWTNGAIIPTVTNSWHQVTFTPTDTANYNTLTNDVHVQIEVINGTTITIYLDISHHTTWNNAGAVTYAYFYKENDSLVAPVWMKGTGITVDKFSFTFATVYTHVIFTRMNPYNLTDRDYWADGDPGYTIWSQTSGLGIPEEKDTFFLSDGYSGAGGTANGQWDPF